MRSVSMQKASPITALFGKNLVATTILVLAISAGLACGGNAAVSQDQERSPTAHEEHQTVVATASKRAPATDESESGGAVTELSTTPTEAAEFESVPEEKPKETEDPASYRAKAQRILMNAGQVARLLNGVALEISSSPESATKTESTTRAAIDTLTMLRKQLEAEHPPDGLQETHDTLLKSLELYAKSAEKLLPDPETGKGDFWEYLPLFQEAGKNFHAVGGGL